MITPATLHDINSKYHLLYMYHFTDDGHNLRTIRERLELLAHIGMMLDKGDEFVANDFGFNGNTVSCMARDEDGECCELYEGCFPFVRAHQEEIEIYPSGWYRACIKVNRWIYRLDWTPKEIAEFVNAVYLDLGIVRR